MFANRKPDLRLYQLAKHIQVSREPTRDLLSRVIAETCLYIPVTASTQKRDHIKNLIEAGAWTDAALTIIDIELPQWQVRRMLYDERRWFCSLSRFPNLPIELDDTADGRHEILPLAMLIAFVVACRMAIVRRDSDQCSSKQPSLGPDYVIYCHDFG